MLNYKSLESDKLYILNSKQTGKPYLDEERCCYLFRDAKDAGETQNTFPDTFVGDPWFYEREKLAALCYAAGADYIKLKIGKEEAKLPLTAEIVKVGPYNHELAGVLALLKQTRQQRYLKKLALCEFIVAVKIKKNPELEIVYGIVKHTIKEVDPLYLVFSDLEEYNLWATNVPGWSPLKISCRELQRMRGKHGIMINPSGNRMILKAKDLQDIPIPAEKPQEDEQQKEGE